MKPGEDMHSSVEEVDLDPSDMYLDLGALIVEGRVPGLTDRGFGEGPHCPPAAGASQNRHHCDTETPECQRHEQMQKHMLLLWKNSIPMSIEVLLYPSCCSASAPIQNVDTSSLPDMSYIMLEQWTVHMLPRRVPDASINPRGLMQAIRSFLYFSQLCAWFSLTGGKAPQNVHYRICVPGEAFCSRFSGRPDCHIFPIANVGRNTAMKVLVKTHPRCGEIPVVLCHKHPSSSLPLKAIKQEAKSDDCTKQMEKPLASAKEDFIDGILPSETQLNSRTSSPADTMLGESLLDPPNSLCLYPKRYQSPSRCGSPSLEVPEHLMFGKSASVSRDAQRQRLNSDMQNRSRPLQRPVFQRVLEKKFNDNFLSSSSVSAKKTDNHHDELDVVLQTFDKVSSCADIDVQNYFCLNDSIKEVPKAEMENVLHRLRTNHCSRHSYDRSHCPYRFNSSEKINLLNKQLSLEESLPKTAFNTAKLPFHLKKTSHTVYNLTSSKPSFHQIQKSLLSYKPESVSKQLKQIESEYKNKDRHSKTHIEKDIGLCNLDYNDVNAYKKALLKDGNINHNQNIAMDKGSLHHVDSYADTIQANKTENGAKSSTYQTDFIGHRVPSNFAGVNIKKCGALLQSLTLSDKLIDERKLVDESSSLPFLQKQIKSRSPDTIVEDLDYCTHVIPSAEEKAQFRRSLDSATNLVFHQKNGLPLTSSPAPIRKSGTCFDFDSSLTSVSAIKRALFEKEPEEEGIEKPKCMHSSVSAPSSMTVSSLLGTFEESVLNGRLEPVSTVEGFTAEIGASGSFCPRHITLPVTIFFYTLQDIDKVTSPYLGHINLGKRDYHIPKKGTVQVTLFNPHHTVVKMFVVRYDLSDMPPNCQTFLRQRTLYMPTDASDSDEDAQKWLRYLIHLRFASTKSRRIYLHTDVRMIIFRKSDLDAATVHGKRPYELRSFTQGPVNPKFSPHKV